MAKGGAQITTAARKRGCSSNFWGERVFLALDRRGRENGMQENSLGEK